MRTIRTPRKFARSAPTGQAEARMASPVGTASPMPRPSRNAGSFRGGMSGYRVPGVATTENAAQERALIQSRSADLTANDWAASSAVNAITTNAVGQGLQPQSDSRLGTPRHLRTGSLGAARRHRTRLGRLGADG